MGRGEARSVAFMTDWNEGSCRAAWLQMCNLVVMMMMIYIDICIYLYLNHRLYGWDWTVVLLD